jgi:hypothetical protein
MNLAVRLGTYVHDNNLGAVSCADSILRMTSSRVRLPHVVFVSLACLPQTREPIPTLAPDLAVEVLSASNTAAEKLPRSCGSTSSPARASRGSSIRPPAPSPSSTGRASQRASWIPPTNSTLSTLYRASFFRWPTCSVTSRQAHEGDGVLCLVRSGADLISRFRARELRGRPRDRPPSGGGSSAGTPYKESNVQS